LGRDPIEEKGGLNLYGFVLNNPINAWDYLGMNTFFVWEPYYDDAGDMLGTRMVEHDGFTTQQSGRGAGDDRIDTQFGYLSAQYFQSWGVSNGWRTGDLTNRFNALTEAQQAAATVEFQAVLAGASENVTAALFATNGGTVVIQDSTDPTNPLSVYVGNRIDFTGLVTGVPIGKIQVQQTYVNGVATDTVTGPLVQFKRSGDLDGIVFSGGSFISGSGQHGSAFDSNGVQYLPTAT
jgi:hypothetical protein